MQAGASGGHGEDYGKLGSYLYHFNAAVGDGDMSDLKPYVKDVLDGSSGQFQKLSDAATGKHLPAPDKKPYEK